MNADFTYSATPVDEARRVKILIAALSVLNRESATPLECQWAKEVADLACALGGARNIENE